MNMCQPLTEALSQSNSIEVIGLYWKLVDEFYVGAAEQTFRVDSPTAGFLLSNLGSR
jgi:hypothetical protein